MTRIKKLLIAGLMAVVTFCVSLGSAIINISQSIFSWISVGAATNYTYSNENEGDTSKNGSILQIGKITYADDESFAKVGKDVYIPKNIKVFDIDEENEGALVEVPNPTIVVDIRDPYGDKLVYTEGTNAGKSANDQVDDESDENYVLTPNNVGVYTVQYAYKNADNVWTISDIYSISVSKAAYTLEMPTNDPIVLPTQIDTNQGVSTEVTLPLPRAYDEDGNLIEKFVLGKESDDVYYVAEYKKLGGKVYNQTTNELEHEYVVALDDNNIPEVYDYLSEDALDEHGKAAIPTDRNVYDSYQTYYVRKLTQEEFNQEFSGDNAIKYGLYVEAYNAGNGKIYKNFNTNSDELMTLNFGTATQKYYVASAYHFTAGSGKNIVRYRLYDRVSGNYTTPYSYLPDITIEGTTNLNKDDISFGVSTNRNIVYSDTSLMDKCYLPEVNAVDKNNNSNSLNAYYYYSVEYIGNFTDDVTTNDAVKSKDNQYVSLGVDENGLYFIPKVEGTYNIYYNAQGFYEENTDANADKYDYDVVVTDRVAPSLKLTNSYDMDNMNKANKEIVATDYSYVIPTKYYTNAENPTKIAIPAIYTTDSVLSFDKLLVTRTITSEDGFKNVATYGKTDKNYKINIQTDSGSTTNNGVVTVKTNADGDTENLNIVSFNNVANGDYTNFYVQDNIFYKRNGVEMNSGDLDFRKAKTSQVAYITLDPKLFGEGKYTIEYSVSGGSNGTSSNKTGDTFTFELVYADSVEDVDDAAPTVEFTDSAIVDVVKNQTISINKPTIKDEVDTGSSKSSNRSITLDRYFVLIENGVGNEDADGNRNTFVPLTLTDDNKLVFNTSDVAAGENETAQSIYTLALNAGKFKVVCFSYDDFADPTHYVKNPLTGVSGTANGQNSPEVYYATRDFSEYTADPSAFDAHIGYGEFEITVKNTDDNIAPKFISKTQATVEYTTAPNGGYEQYQEAKVNGIVFRDNTANDRITVKVLDSKGNSYDYEEFEKESENEEEQVLSGIKAISDGDYTYEYTLAGIKFVANRADNYTINFVVTDEGNNSMCYSYVLVSAKDRETPVITDVMGVSDSMELGTSKKISVKAIDNSNGELTYQVKVFDQDGRNMSFAYFNNETMTFTPRATGSYTIQVKALDTENNASTAETFTIKVSDTLAPEIVYSGFQDNISITELYNNGNPNSNEEVVDWDKVFPEVALAGFTVMEKYPNEQTECPTGFTGVFGTSGTLKITTPNSDSYTITNNQTTIEGENPLNIRREGNNFYFTPTRRGEYKVVYSGTDNAGNVASNEKTITVNIGDTVKPKIELSESLLNSLKNGFVLNENAELLINTKVSFNSTSEADLRTSKTNGDIYLSDNFGFKNLGTDDDVYTNVSVQILDANNNSISSTNSTNEATGVEYKKFEFTTAGTYTINITASDSVGNSYTLSKTFKVTTVEASASESSKVLGIVLISVSIVILACVVIYFVRGTKFLPKRRKAKKDKPSKEENKD